MKRSTPLAATEACFQDNVLSGDATIDDLIEGSSAEFRDTRLAIYRDAYRLRLIEVLGNDYEALHAYLGDEVFDVLATDYIAACPSTFRNVRWFGGTLAQFLSATPRWAAHPELSGLAQFEWSLVAAFDSADTGTVDFAQVAAVAPHAWATLRFTPHPALRLLDLRSNAVAIWKAIDRDDAAIEPECFPDPVTWVVWRKQYSPFFRSLQTDEAWALKAMMAQASFGEICAGLCEWVAEDQAAARAAGLLRGWVEEGWIAALVIAD